MHGAPSRRRPARTVLEQRIREMNLTFEEFAEYAETFAREHGEPGTLSVRHLQRLVTGRQPDGSPLPFPRPATARLLERIFKLTIQELLGPSACSGRASAGELLRVAVAVVRREDRVLLVCRRGTNGHPNVWQFPSGIIKPGESRRVVAVAETLAETAIRSKVIQDLGGRMHPITNVHCSYLLCEYLAGCAENKDREENADVLWVPIGEIYKLIPVKNLFTKVMESLAPTPYR